MLNVEKIDLNEFESTYYDMFVNLFPESERRPWDTILDSNSKGVETFLKIELDNTPIGFLMLEKLDNHPYYLEYFGIIEEYQNKGYGSLSIKKLIEIIKDDGLICEIEDINTDELSLKRYEFYKKLGFKLIDKAFIVFEVLYNPLVYNFESDNIVEVLCDYYIFNAGYERFKNNFKLIR